MDDNLSIRAAAERYRVSARTLRFYEEAGILASRRKEGSRYREYDAEQVKRLEVILLLRRLSFTIQDIAGLLKGDEADFQRALRQKIAQSDRALMEARETNRLLRSVAAQLSRKPPRGLRAAELLGEYAYLTRQTERMIPMKPEQEPNHIALGADIAMPVVSENEGDILGRIKAFRENCSANHLEPPPRIRIFDTPDLPPRRAVIVWNGVHAWSRDFPEQDGASVSETLMEQILALHGA